MIGSGWDFFTSRQPAMYGIDDVLEYDKLAEAYNPITSDPVKFDAYRSEQTWKERKAYFKAWFQQFLKHPGVYVEASINGCMAFSIRDQRNGMITWISAA